MLRSPNGTRREELRVIETVTPTVSERLIASKLPSKVFGGKFGAPVEDHTYSVLLDGRGRPWLQARMIGHPDCVERCLLNEPPFTSGHKQVVLTPEQWELANEVAVPDPDR